MNIFFFFFFRKNIFISFSFNFLSLVRIIIDGRWMTIISAAQPKMSKHQYILSSIFQFIVDEMRESERARKNKINLFKKFYMILYGSRTRFSNKSQRKHRMSDQPNEWERNGEKWYKIYDGAHNSTVIQSNLY